MIEYVGRGVLSLFAQGSRLVIALAALLMSTMAASTAAKAEFFDFSYSANGISAMGTFTATQQSAGRYLITAISGTRNGLTIDSLIPTGQFYGVNNNILFFPGTPYYFNENRGFAYKIGNAEYNAYTYLDGYQEAQGGTSTFLINSFEIEQVPAPLPGGGLLSFLALGLATLGYHRETLVGRVGLALARRRSQSSVLTA